MDTAPSLKENTLLRIDKNTKLIYAGLLILNLAILIAGVYAEVLGHVILSIPIILVLVFTLLYDSEFLHIPPILIMIINAAMIISLIARAMAGVNPVMIAIINILIGIVLGSIGIVISYMSLGKMPGFAKEKPIPIMLESFSIGVSLFVLSTLIGYYLSMITDYEFDSSLSIFADRISWVIVGSALVVLYFFRSNGPVRKGIEGFLFKNSDVIGIERDEVESVKELIATGESFNLEFKSTIRLNLKTGEKDKRMEKAVLKTLVAFLNGDGGTLLVGVADDGEILGVDIEGFDNCDKMNLHIINLISSQIGDEFLPFIRFREVNFGKKENGSDRLVVRFDCKPTSSPVFFKDGKTETYFVRSGPSSVELLGSDLIKYVQNRRKTVGRKYPFARLLSQPQNFPEESSEEE